jgi:hypothetical protein
MRLLCKRIDPACCIAIVFIALKVCLMLDEGISNSSSSCFIDGMCVVTFICFEPNRELRTSLEASNFLGPKLRPHPTRKSIYIINSHRPSIVKRETTLLNPCSLNF